MRLLRRVRRWGASIRMNCTSGNPEVLLALGQCIGTPLMVD